MKSVSSESNKAHRVTKGDVFDHLGLSHFEATEAKVKSDLWRELVDHISSLALSQKELARALGIHQPDVSHLLNGKISKFSAGTLIQYAVRLNLGVHVSLTVPKSRRGAVKSLSAGAGAGGGRRGVPVQRVP